MFSVINIGDPKWVAACMGLPKERRDIHLDQRMLAPYVAINHWKAHLAITEGEKGYILQPILVTSDGELRHPYNFGGPIASDESVSDETVKEHDDSLREWAKNEVINREYCTLIPNLAQEQIKSLNLTPKLKKF